MPQSFVDLARTPGIEIKRFDLVLFPIGSLERHGNHLPLGTDTIIAEAFAKSIAKELGIKGYKVAVLPPLWYGYTWSLRYHDGTASVDPHTLSKFIEEIIVSLSNPRLSRTLIINGHGGNKEPIAVAIKEALTRLGPGVRIGAISWWDFLDQEVLERVLPGSVPSHACEVETSLMLYLCEDCVTSLEDVEKVEVPPRRLLRSLEDTRKLFSKGYLGEPKKASKEAGKIIFESVTRNIVNKLLSELKEEEEHGIE